MECLYQFIALGEVPQRDPILKGFNKIFIELSIGADDIIYGGDKFLLPQSLLDEVISLVHAGSHAGQDESSNASRPIYGFLAWKLLALKHAMNAKYIQEARSKCPSQTHPCQTILWILSHSTCSDPYQTNRTSSSAALISPGFQIQK